MTDFIGTPVDNSIVINPTVVSVNSSTAYNGEAVAAASITDNIIKIKVFDDFDATEANTNLVSLYFPFTNEKSTFSRYRAQLFYAPSNLLTSISIAVAKGSDYPTYDLPIGVFAYEEDPNTNYGIDNPANVVFLSDGTIKISDASISYFSNNQRTPFVTVDGLNSTVVAGSPYWLVFDCGKIYDSTNNVVRTHDFYFSMTTGGWTAVGTNVGILINPTMTYDVSETQGQTLLNTAPIRSDISAWNFTDFPRDHIFMINGASPVQVQYSLASNLSLLSPLEDLYASEDWQALGYKEISITNPSYGGDIDYGSKNVYVRFARPNSSGVFNVFSNPLISKVLYTPGIPVINEVLLSYVGVV